MTSDVKAEPARLVANDPAVAQAAMASWRMPTAARLHRLLARCRSERLRPLLPLLLVLGVQATLSLCLTNTASPDEALVLFTGRAEFKGLIHEAVVATVLAPYFVFAHFYHPIIGAMADARFVLETVRLLSLLAMLGTTALLWSSTRALFGRPAAIGAVTLFGLASPTLFLGHAAVSDVPAVFLYAASLRILIATARRSLWTTLLAVPTTVLAAAISHATVLYIPVLALTAGFAAATAAPGPDRRLPHLARGALFAGAAGALAVGWIALGRPADPQGLGTTINPVVATESFATVMTDYIRWGSAFLVLGLLGTLAVAKRRRADPRDPHRVAPVLLTLTLAAAAMLPLAYALHNRSLQSLQQQTDVALLLSAAAAGVTLSVPLRTAWPARARYGVVIVAALGLAAVGAVQSDRLFDRWPNSAALVTVLEHAMGKGGERYLAENPIVPQYYTADLPNGARNDWENAALFRYRDSAGKYVSGLTAYRQAIADRYFKLIVLSSKETPTLDKEIGTPLKAHPGYRLIDVVPASDVFGRTDYAVWEAVD